MSLGIRSFLYPKQWKSHIRDFARTAPMIAAVLAPFSVLFDIPSVTERWYIKNGLPQPDPKVNLILSSIALAFGIVANLLLIFRFSSTGIRWRAATRASCYCWFVKVVISTVNLAVFGARVNGKTYYEGFWCGVVSDVTSGIILSLLLLHFFFSFMSLRKGGGLLLDTLFSEIGWTYLDGIYYTIVSFLSVGFGDFLAKKTASRILIFPFCLIGIALLGSLITLIVGFFSDRAADRKAIARSEYERRRQKEENDLHERSGRPADIQREIQFLTEINERQDFRDEIQDFTLATVGFLTFWVVGAAVFSAIEGWGYGTGMYFCYVVFLTIGYGDVVPVTPAGKVVFIVFSLLAIPIMAAFAVQAITEVVTRISIWRLNNRKAAAGVDKTTAKATDKAPPVSHAEYVERFSSNWENSLKGRNSRSRDTNGYGGDGDDEKLLLKEMLKQAVELEAHARQLLVNHLPKGSKSQAILKADRNIQLRDIKTIRQRYDREEEDPSGVQRAIEGGGRIEDAFGGPDSVSKPLSEEETLDEVNMYREAFASILVAGSRLSGLEGRVRYLFERREEGKDQHKGMEKDRSVAKEAKARKEEDTL
ncbi:hypothetical protein FRB95_011146 [Tulasnella sp. JGI-2019a]|nr:hypothetical protein FRB95_011146 [Tulasnella sp. JGI-2019a]